VATLALWSVVAAAAAPTEGVRVAAGLVEAVAEQAAVTISGELSALRSALLSAEVAGVVVGVVAESGDRVKEGDVLATIRDQQVRLELRADRGRVAEAEAEVERARINERRLGRLLKRKALSQDEYDTARVELQKALAVLETRRAEAALRADALERHQFRAPFAGVVVAREIELGQWVDVGDPAYLLEDVSVLRAVLPVPQQYFDVIGPGTRADIVYDARPGEVQEAVVSRRLPVIRRAGRTFELWVDIDNADLHLVPGLSLRARVVLPGAGEERVALPRDAVVSDAGGETWVWAIHDEGQRSTVQRVDVRVEGVAGEALIVAASELREGMRVVTRGNESLRAGQLVQLTGG
jgi:RND family efflux transporter MFP subunit